MTRQEEIHFLNRAMPSKMCYWRSDEEEIEVSNQRLLDIHLISFKGKKIQFFYACTDIHPTLFCSSALGAKPRKKVNSNSTFFCRRRYFIKYPTKCTKHWRYSMIYLYNFHVNTGDIAPAQVYAMEWFAKKCFGISSQQYKNWFSTHLYSCSMREWFHIVRHHNPQTIFMSVKQNYILSLTLNWLNFTRQLKNKNDLQNTSSVSDSSDFPTEFCTSHLIMESSSFLETLWRTSNLPWSPAITWSFRNHRKVMSGGLASALQDTRTVSCSKVLGDWILTVTLGAYLTSNRIKALITSLAGRLWAWHVKVLLWCSFLGRNLRMERLLNLFPSSRGSFIVSTPVLISCPLPSIHVI